MKGRTEAAPCVLHVVNNIAVWCIGDIVKKHGTVQGYICRQELLRPPAMPQGRLPHAQHTL